MMCQTIGNGSQDVDQNRHQRAEIGELALMFELKSSQYIGVGAFIRLFLRSMTIEYLAMLAQIEQYSSSMTGYKVKTALAIAQQHLEHLQNKEYLQALARTTMTNAEILNNLILLYQCLNCRFDEEISAFEKGRPDTLVEDIFSISSDGEAHLLKDKPQGAEYLLRGYSHSGYKKHFSRITIIFWDYQIRRP